ncbi:thiamine biosynthesis lipoprotein [Pseudomonas sp. BIGb0408]|uniref:FAD:protein FMN transferase n=1 Tax=Phytopseudomonas flavescens TaxID=29435 RepID=A0A7Y9XLM0_9GAMM|nr:MULTISPECIES: FAD:protein FMN transferase [Pseudomonas]MCW2291844.1 thiamine biosynthesis lipoprotein [Pseudomonas sp. BIGb0408]NYH73585.1 thiamine biosynthesis lipoprotein [Pseudomonas flavescens]
MIPRAAILQPALVTALAVALAGCGFSERVEEFGGPAQGSTYSVKYVSTASAPDKAALKAEVEAIFSEVDEQMSTYRDDSLIEQFNRAPAGTCMPMPEGVLTLVQTGDELHRDSGGAFDLTLEPLLDLWGFGPRGNGERQVPDGEALKEVRGRIGQQHLHIEGDRLCKDLDLQVDFNSIAAGYTVDRIIERLVERGVRSYLVEATGELKAVGRKPDGQPWRIALEAPRDDQRTIQRVIELDGYGISTSGDYRNYFEEQGVRYSHTLDPQTAAPIQHTLAAVTVAAPSTLMADGLSTVLLVLGPEKGYAYAEREGIAAFFVTREGDGFVTRSTATFEQLFAAGGKQ